MLERIKIFKRKDINTVVDEQILSRRPLNPKILDKNDCSYPCVEELQYAIEKSNCKNIVLTGVYGSGKSSVIETYLEKQTFCKNPLKISLSTFYNENDHRSEPNDIVQYNADIEYKIVQHILYKSDPMNLRQSRFERIIHQTPQNIKKKSICILFAVLAVIILFEPDFLKVESFNRVYLKILDFEKGYLVDVVADVVAAIYLFFCLGCAIYKGLSHYYSIRISSVKTKNVEFDFSKNSSVFNQLLDEIVYSFNANRYDLVLFEDLDRLYKPESLFLKLRELNMLLNESETFHKDGFVVKFIYAVRDDIFPRELRTKCFDYIIPVAPVIDRFNASDYLLKHKSKFFQTIDDDAIRDLGIWIVGFRELNNILNEFCLFKKLVLREGMSEEKLLAMTIYKNIQPQDYSLLHDKAGLLYNIFLNKRLFSKPFTKELVNKISSIESEIAYKKLLVENIKKDYLNYFEKKYNVKTLFIGDNSFSIEEVLSSDMLFDKLKNDAFSEYYFFDELNKKDGRLKYTMKFKDIEDEIGNGTTYETKTYPIFSEIQQKQDEIASLNRSINSIENDGLFVIFNMSDGEENKNNIKKIYEKIKVNGNNPIDEDTIAFLQVMIRDGFIAEDYPSYVSFYHSGSMSDGDFDFLNSVLQGISKPYNTSIVNPKQVVDKLVTESFNTPYVLNFSILNYLLENKSEVAHLLEKFIFTARKNPSFIVEYCKSKEDPFTFLSILFNNWNNPIIDIQAIKEENLRTEMWFWYIFTCNTSVKLSDEEKEFINDKYSFINQNINRIDFSRLKRYIEMNDVKFHTLAFASDQNQKVLLKYVSTTARFDINFENMRIILGKDYETQPYTTIYNINDSGFKKYVVDENIELTINTFSTTSREEGQDALVQLINNEEIAEEWLSGYVAQQEMMFDSFENIKEERQHFLLNIDKVKAGWDNVLSYYTIHSTLDHDFFDFIKRNREIFAQTHCNGDINVVQSLYVKLFGNDINLEFDSYQELINCFTIQLKYQDISGLEEKRIVILIERKKIDYSSKLVDFIETTYSENTFILFVIKYFEEIDTDDELEIDDYIKNSFVIKILESELTLGQKIKFIDSYATIEEDLEDSSYYANLICKLYVEWGNITESSNKELLCSAIKLNKESDSWRNKITLINRLNAYYSYDKEIEKELINSLGGEMYPKLNTLYGRAHFDINEENRQLITYLREQGHYVKNYSEREGQIYVSFMSHEP